MMPVVLLAATLAAAPAAADDSCEALMRRIKLSVFDQEWQQVQESATRLLGEFPDCRHRQQASYLLAQALDRGGQPERALAAYSGFLEDFCGPGSEAIDCGLARVALYDLAARQYERTSQRDYLSILTDGLKRPGDAGVFAALTLADMRDTSLRSRALPRLKEAYASDADPDVRNRICLAILKIDPSQTLCGKAGGTDARARDDGPSLISVEVYNKANARVELRVNMPVILAESVIKALPNEIRQQMADEGINIEQIYQAVREQAMGTIFEAETPEMKIRIWLQ
jgi:hypothetical protein